MIFYQNLMSIDWNLINDAKKALWTEANKMAVSLKGKQNERDRKGG